MKKIVPIILLLLCLCGCQKDNRTFTLNGTISNLKNDTLFIYNDFSEKGKLDTIIAQNGSFTYTTRLDTITPLTLLINETTEYPIYADKNLKVTVDGDANMIESFIIEGGVHNEDLNEFHKSINGITQQELITAKADSFIRQHPNSYANLYLIDKYFVQTASPDFKTILALIKSMNGELQDQPSMKQLSEIAKKQKERINNKIAPYFSIKNKKGELLTLANYKDKYLLINFWATWDDASLKENQALKKISKKFKKEKAFTMLGVSLDIDKKAWEETIQKDTLNWEQVIELDGFDGSTAEQFCIEKLPANVLIGPKREIIAVNLFGKQLTDKLEEVLKESSGKSNKNNK